MGRGAKQGFNTPFSDLKAEMKEKLRVERKARKETEREVSAPPPSPNSADQSRRPSGVAAKDTGAMDEGAVDEAALFESWVGDVRPLSRDVPGRVAPQKLKEPPPGTSVPDEDSEVLATLSDLVAGEGSFEISDTDEYVEGIAPGLDRRLLKRLKHGDFSVQAHLDLHGMVKDEARQAVEKFVRHSRHAARRCVIIVHGRGLRSPGGEPVLKKALVKWLSRGSLANQVLAFCTTLAHDGGGGAVYVLLRR